MSKKYSKQLNMRGRTAFYGWYIRYKYNLTMSFENFLSPTNMSAFLAARLDEVVSETKGIKFGGTV